MDATPVDVEGVNADDIFVGEGLYQKRMVVTDP
jgi:hypothetical protein